MLLHVLHDFICNIFVVMHQINKQAHAAYVRLNSSNSQMSYKFCFIGFPQKVTKIERRICKVRCHSFLCVCTVQRLAEY